MEGAPADPFVAAAVRVLTLRSERTPAPVLERGLAFVVEQHGGTSGGVAGSSGGGVMSCGRAHTAPHADWRIVGGVFRVEVRHGGESSIGFAMGVRSGAGGAAAATGRETKDTRKRGVAWIWKTRP